MKKNQKTVLLILFILIFLILSNFLIIYAAGYKFDIKNFQWQKTGGIFAKLNTKKAEFFLNGRLIGKSFAVYNSFPIYYRFSKKRVLPGNYSLIIKKDGYFSLNKTIQVLPGIVTPLHHIYLVNKNEIEKLISQTIKEEQKNTKQKYINESSVEFGKNIYYINKKDGLLYRKSIKDQENKQQLSLASIELKKYRISVLDEDKIYLISQDQSNPGVFFLNKGMWEKIHNQFSDKIALSSDKKKLAIGGNNNIYVIWLEDDEEFPYLTKNHKELIIRISKEIDKLYWFKTNWHLIYKTNTGEYHFVEVDPTGGRNDIKLGLVVTKK